jgi:hypothetical protein
MGNSFGKRQGHGIWEHQTGNIEKLLKSGELGQKAVTPNLTSKVPHFSSNNASKLVIT